MFRRWAALAIVVALACAAGIAHAQQTPITRYTRLTGNINFVATGGTLRTQDNNGDPCTVGTTSTAALTGVPVGATIVAAYLYWGGSGSTIDSSVTLNGSAVAAARTFTATFNNAGTNYPYFGAFADVTSRVAGNGSFTFTGLTVATGTPHCSVSAVAAGWSLIVIYGSPSERLRAINVFDGLQYFRGSSLTLNPDGFRIPPTAYDGRIAIFALEGDPGNSTPLNGFSESLTFNGTALNDGINVSGSDPLVQPYDGTVNSLGIATSWGVDVDTFDVTALVAPGQTSATTVFSAGGDLVLLIAQVVSATSEPVVDLSLTKSHTGNFVAGGTGTYTLRVANAAGVQREDNTVVVTDTLPAGLTFVSGVGTGWSCSASGQIVTCSHAPFLDPGQAFPDLTLTVAVGAAAAPAVTNAATVSSASFDVNAANNAASDPTTVLAPNLSTSTKAVQDLNGGEADPGDTLRFTITINETAGVPVAGVAVTDPLPTNTSNLSVVSVPAGASNNSTAALLDVAGIAIAGGGSVTIVFDVTVPAGTAPGSPIDNTATIANPFGPGATPSSPTVIVSPSRIPSSGSKPLYLRNSGGTPLSRTPPGSGEGSVTIAAAGTVTWSLTPALQTPLQLAAGNVSIPLWLSRNNSGGGNRTLVLTLANSVTGTIGTVTTTVSPPNSTTPALSIFVLNVPATTTFPAGSTFQLSVRQQTPGSGAAITRVHPNGTSSGAWSRVLLNSNTVINVDSVAAFDAAYPGGTATTSFFPGSTVYVRAVVSDPFGSFDIAGATLTLIDALGATQVSNQAMTQVADSGTSTRTFQSVYALPVAAAPGGWTMRVTATEGTEGTVTDLGVAGITVVLPMPALRVTKVSEVLSDPVNGTTNPKRIPGAVVRYAVSVANSGPGTVDASSLVITDRTPSDAAMYVAAGGGGPVDFVDGTPASGLSFVPAVHVSWSNQPGGGAPYTYTPVPDAQGFDAAVTGVRIAPAGTMNAASGAGQPNFTVRFRVRVQ